MSAKIGYRDVTKPRKEALPTHTARLQWLKTIQVQPILIVGVTVYDSITSSLSRPKLVRYRSVQANFSSYLPRFLPKYLYT